LKEQFPEKPDENTYFLSMSEQFGLLSSVNKEIGKSKNEVQRM